MPVTQLHPEEVRITIIVAIDPSCDEGMARVVAETIDANIREALDPYMPVYVPLSLDVAQTLRSAVIGSTRNVDHVREVLVQPVLSGSGHKVSKRLEFQKTGGLKITNNPSPPNSSVKGYSANERTPRYSVNIDLRIRKYRP